MLSHAAAAREGLACALVIGVGGLGCKLNTSRSLGACCNCSLSWTRTPKSSPGVTGAYIAYQLEPEK